MICASSGALGMSADGTGSGRCRRSQDAIDRQWTGTKPRAWNWKADDAVVTRAAQLAKPGCGYHCRCGPNARSDRVDAPSHQSHAGQKYRRRGEPLGLPPGGPPEGLHLRDLNESLPPDPLEGLAPSSVGRAECSTSASRSCAPHPGPRLRSGPANTGRHQPPHPAHSLRQKPRPNSDGSDSRSLRSFPTTPTGPTGAAAPDT